MSSNADCFVVLPSNCVIGSLIFGRNAEDRETVGVATEICYYDVKDSVKGETDGGASVEPTVDAMRIILQKPKPGIWGADFGANERGVAVALTWTDGRVHAKDSNSLLGTDIVRITLAECNEADAALERIGALVEKHCHDRAKLNFIVCDPQAAWILSSSGKVWAAEKVQASWRRVPSGGLTVTETIDKCSEGLDTTVNFAEAHNAEALPPPTDWCGLVPAVDVSYTEQDMFDTLREACGAYSRAATVSALSTKGRSTSCHWFTGTPNAAQSVFKPFVFSPKPLISPLTQVQGDSEKTLLHTLHARRNPAALTHLRSLERSCVDEMNNYFSIQDHVSEELDELLKDCVEAEVKFYR